LDDDGDEVGVEGVGGGFGGKRVHVERSLVWVWSCPTFPIPVLNRRSGCPKLKLGPARPLPRGEYGLPSGGAR
jgi:hypothetical protein